MSQTSHARNCPICISPSKDAIIKIDFELFEGHPMNGGYNVVQCNNCGFIYADTTVTQNELDWYYTELSKYEDKTISTGGGFTQKDKDRLIETAVFLSQHIPDKNARIVDLGCANGGMLKELKNLGYTNLVGIDPSSACIKITEEEVGCECYQHSLFDIPESVGKFDVVILSHVLEHVLNVRETISITDNLLKDNGALYLECPNAEYYYDVIHAPLQEFNAEHINHFTETAFENLMGLYHYSKTITGDKTMVIASNQDYHAVYGLFRKENTHDDAFNVRFDTSIRGRINQYIDDSNKIFDEIKKTIAAFPKDKTVALFGIGQFAFKLLKTDVFQHGRKFILFDNNRMNVGKKISGKEIMPGDGLVAAYRKEAFVIIISSLIYETAISKNIHELFEKNGEKSPEIIGFSRLLTQK
jgi:2-polyprenyl-3-methyl-5-hydroxy-6-metoxy-1,4-benzoquinol methylase